MKNSALLTIFATTTVLLASACSMENADSKQISAGLSCLDTATTSTDADNCVSKVSGLSSPQSYLIRCSAHFIAQGLTGSRIGTAFQQLKTQQSSGSQTSALASYLVFAKSLTNHTADLTFSDCNLSGVSGVIGLASMVQFATTIASVYGGSLDGSPLDPSSGSFNTSQLLTYAQTLYNDSSASATTKKTAIGQAAVAAQTSYCGAGSSLKDQDVCTKLNAAIASAGTDSAAIGQALLNQVMH